MDTTQKVNLYLGVVLYAVVIVTCTVTFLQDKATADVLASIQARELKRAAFALTPTLTPCPRAAFPGHDGLFIRRHPRRRRKAN